MRILLTIGDISTTGGVERVCVNLANALNELGYRVEILSFYRTNTHLPYKLDSGVKLHFWHNTSESDFRRAMSTHFFSKLYYKNLYKFILSMRVQKQFCRVDAVITNCSNFIPFWKRKGVKYIRFIHMAFERFNTRNKFFDTLVILSRFELGIWQRYHHHIRVIPNFVPCLPPPRKNAAYLPKIVLSVGRMDEGDQKGFLRLIDIWALVRQKTQFIQGALHDWQLVIVGDGVMKSEIQAKINAKGLQDSIVLKPFTQTIESEYSNASIYAMSSHTEGFPMVLIEASSHSLPCVAFDIATGPGDIIVPDQSGYLVEDNDLEGFASRLLELMDSESKRKEFGENARQRVAQKMSKEAIMPLWQALLCPDQP